MHLLTPAKINLHLRVGPPRSDGFHPLFTWMTTIGLFDKLTIEQSHDGQIRLSCDAPGVPGDASNLVVRTATALADWLTRSTPERMPDKSGLVMRLEKSIPAGAGLGGGSSNGAFTLAALNTLWNIGLTREALAEFATRFGSDLSFFFFQPSALCRGRGDLVTPLPRPAAGWAVLVLPQFHMPTPAVYRRFDEIGLGALGNLSPEPNVPHWASLNASGLLAVLRNDLEVAAFSIEPRLAVLREKVEQRLGRIVRMSGSGSTLFTLYDQEKLARDAAVQISQDFVVKAVAVDIAPQWTDDLARAIMTRES